MKLFRAFLWLVLFISLGWLSLILFGSNIVRGLATFYYGEDLKLYQVRVTPKLEINISRLEFHLNRSVPESELKGHLKDIKFSWDFTDGKIGLLSSAKLLKIDDFYTLREPKIYLNNKEFLSLKNIFLEGNFDSFSMKQVDAGPGTISMELMNAGSEIKNIRIDLLSPNLLTLAAPVSADKIRVKIDKYEPLVPYENQASAFSALITNFYVDDGLLNIPKTEVSGMLNNRKFTLRTRSGNVNSTSKNFELSDVHSEIDYPFIGSNDSSKMDVKIGRINYDKNKILLKDYAATITTKGDQVRHLGKALATNITMEYDKWFLGELTDTSLELNIALSSSKGSASFDVELNANLLDQSEYNFSVNASGDANNLLIRKCSVTPCMPKKLEIYGTVRTPRSQLQGELICGGENCSVASSKRTLMTQHTLNFFEDLQKLEIFNPLIIPIALYNVTSGIPKGDGHILKF
jgi:hypothetical protein